MIAVLSDVLSFDYVLLFVSFDAAKVRILFEPPNIFQSFFEDIVTNHIYRGMKIVFLRNLLKQKREQSEKQKNKGGKFVR